LSILAAMAAPQFSRVIAERQLSANSGLSRRKGQGPFVARRILSICLTTALDWHQKAVTAESATAEEKLTATAGASV
jgi:hypothetical protein